MNSRICMRVRNIWNLYHLIEETAFLHWSWRKSWSLDRSQFTPGSSRSFVFQTFPSYLHSFASFHLPRDHISKTLAHVCIPTNNTVQVSPYLSLPLPLSHSHSPSLVVEKVSLAFLRTIHTNINDSQSKLDEPLKVRIIRRDKTVVSKKDAEKEEEWMEVQWVETDNLRGWERNNICERRKSEREKVCKLVVCESVAENKRWCPKAFLLLFIF